MEAGKISKNSKADNILQALLAHHTVRAAAEAAGVSERTVYDYLKNPAFKSRYDAARDDVVRGVSNYIREQMTEAVKIAVEIMSNAESKEFVRLSAVRLMLDYGMRIIETQDILERLTALEVYNEKNKK